MNDPKPQYNLVRLDRKQREELFRQLDGGAAGSGRPVHRNRRSEPRWPYRADDVEVSIDHPGGGTSEFVVLARNLSCNGLAFIHGGFVHPRTTCRIRLSRIDGGVESLTGRIMSCRHVQATLHEVGVRFDAPIDPTQFLSLEHVADDLRPDMLSAIKGSALLVAEEELDASLVAHQLEATDITLTRAASVEEGLGHVGRQAFNVLLVDSALADEVALDHVRALAEGGLADAVVVLTAETGHDRLKAALAAGADHILPKPYEPKELYVLLTRLLRRRTDARPDLTLDAKEGLTEMLLQFIDHAEKMGRQLEEALDAHNLDRARAACLNLKGSAAGFGYPALSEAASDALRVLDDTMSLEDCLQQISGLSAMCKRLAQSGRGPAPQDGDRKVE